MASQTPTQKPTLYFAYGSNLSLTQMSSRCPTATYHSSGFLANHTFVIGPRGYANVVASRNPKDVVYGMLYTLQPADERALDIAEGVPYAYVKLTLPIQLLTPDNEGKTTVQALVYVDTARKGTGKCREEYVERMNRGIRDALVKGIPVRYVEDVLRKWIPEDDGLGDGEVDDPFHPQKMGKAI